MDTFWVVLIVIIFLILFIRAISKTSNSKKRRYFDAAGKVKEESSGFGFGEFILYLLLLDLLFGSSNSDESYNSFNEQNSNFFNDNEERPWERNQEETDIDYFDTDYEDDLLDFDNDFDDDFDDDGWGDD